MSVSICGSMRRNQAKFAGRRVAASSRGRSPSSHEIGRREPVQVNPVVAACRLAVRFDVDGKHDRNGAELSRRLWGAGS